MADTVNGAEAVADALELPVALEPLRDELAGLEEELRDDRRFGQPELAIVRPELAGLLDWVFGSGGKRLRPAVVFAVAKLGEPDPDRIRPLAAAVETLHAATLVHDDLIDRAVSRRGMPTLNTRWSAGAVVLAGDWLFARAARFAAATGSVRVMDVFSRTLGTMTAGELQQLFGREGVPSREEYEYRIYAKTASLFEAAAESSAWLTFESEAEVAALTTYGRQLGMAFQIVDDILDFTGDEERLGKPVGSDLKSGTVTLPALLYLLEHPERQVWLEDDAGSVESLVADIRADTETLDGARGEARARVEEALAAIDRLPASPARSQLAALARYAVERDF